MVKKQITSKQNDIPQVGVSKARPDHYNASNHRNLLDPQQHINYIARHWWRPAPGGYGLPIDPAARQARVDKFYVAMMDFSDVYDSDNVFTDGRAIESNDIEATCLRIANAIDELHNNGLCVPHIADPTTYQAMIKGQKMWKPFQEERDLTAVQRENAVAEHLRHYKKACLDAVQHDKDLIILFIAAPHIAAKKRNANARSNGQRKRRVRDEDIAEFPPARRVATEASRELDTVIHGPKIKLESDQESLILNDIPDTMMSCEVQMHLPASDAVNSAFEIAAANAEPSLKDTSVDTVLDDDYVFKAHEYDWLLES